MIPAEADFWIAIGIFWPFLGLWIQVCAFQPKPRIVTKLVAALNEPVADPPRRPRPGPGLAATT